MVQCAGTAGAWKLRRNGGSNGTAGPLHEACNPEVPGMICIISNFAKIV